MRAKVVSIFVNWNSTVISFQRAKAIAIICYQQEY